MFMNCLTPRLPISTMTLLPLSTLSLDMVLDKAAELLHTTPAKLLDHNRTEPIASLRQRAMWLLRECTGMSFPRLGQVFCRDHSTVVHGCQVVERRIANESEYARTMSGMKAELIKRLASE